MIKTFEYYLIKLFLKKVLIISLVFLSLIFILSIFDEISFFKDLDVNFFFPFLITILNAPSTLFEIFPFIFLIGSQFFFLELIQKNELEVLKINGLNNFKVNYFEETLPNGIKYIAGYSKLGTLKNTDIFTVPANKYFFLGDNRDCSKDSRFLNSVGYVNKLNLVGKAQLIFFSNDTLEGSILKFWNWNNSLRLNRFIKKLQ